ncbi:MAG TPA: acyl-CoA dehydrogenase family protein [Spirochaetota bacterium]|nr:acyl-CoA dehydrogenase family protein [Spirochaetota bacterium]
MIELSDDQKKWIKIAKNFSIKQKASLYAHRSDDRISRAHLLFSLCCEEGFQGLLVPGEYGGSGLDYTTAGLIFEELGNGALQAMPSLLTTIHCIEFISIAGTVEQKKEIFTEVIANSIPLGFGLTETSAGSDITHITCMAEKTETEYILNGTKAIVLNSHIAGIFLIIARLTSGQGRAGLNAFLVRSSRPGIQLSPPYNGLGFRETVIGEVSLTDVRIPHEAIIGDEGSGYFLLMETFDKCKPFVAACCVGAAQKVFDIILEYTKSREQLGSTLFSFQGISFKLADFAAKIRAAKLLYLEALQRIDTHSSFTMEASIAKLYASETLREISEFGLEVLGYRGVLEDNPVREIFEDAQLLIPIDGSSNIQRMIIASQL